MISAAQIAAASATLTDEAQMLALLYVRESPDYRAQPHRYQSAPAKIAAATPIQAQTTNAILAVLETIEAKGAEKTVMIEGNEKGLNYSADRDRKLLQNYILSVYFDKPAPLNSFRLAEITGLDPDATEDFPRIQ